MSNKLLLCFQLIFLIIFLRGLILKGRQISWKTPWELSLLLFSIPIVMLFLTQIGYRNLYLERYLIFVLPFFLIVIARGASEVSKPGLDILIILFLFVIGVVSYTMFYQKNTTRTVYKQNPDWRSAANYLKSNIESSENSIIFSITPDDALKYYLRKEEAKPFRIIRFRNRSDILLAFNSKSFYLIKNRYWIGGFDKVFEIVTKNKLLHIVSTHSFKGIDVYYFVKYE